MADSSTNLNTIAANAAQKEVAANALFDAGSPSTLLGRNDLTTGGTTWGYYGGKVLIGGTVTSVANGTVALSGPTALNYVEFDPVTGSVSANTTAFTAGRIPLYSVQVTSGAIASYTDQRTWGAPVHPRLSKGVGGGVNVTLTQAEARADIIELTGTLTANIAVILPVHFGLKVFRNLTTGAFTLTIRTAGGTGPAPAQNRSILAYGNGTDVIRVSPDQATP
jgi:hypothetical protein